MISRSARITLLLVIDLAFFFVELIVGYAVGSLALVADSLHMLSDVISLIIALYAIKLTAQTDVDPRYSYGWARSELIAAFANSIFLIALCFSISLEALERFFSSPEIANPRLVVIVGSLGLASNIVGLFLFHEHGHSHDHPPSTPLRRVSHDETLQTFGDTTPTQKIPIQTRRSRSRSPSLDSYSSLYGHPAATRASLVKTAQELAARSPSPTERRHSLSQSRPSLDLGSRSRTSTTAEQIIEVNESHSHGLGETSPLLEHNEDDDEVHHHEGHSGHNHSHGGHSHGSMNMRALVLHVVGDALGNVGVIATGLIIWLTDWSFKYYCDPIISLVITVIIFSSALPLARSTSFILLQGVPSNVSLEEVRSSILAVEGIMSLHELHVWQLSETKIIASVHVLTSRDHDFMPVAAKIRKMLHEHGIHSSTIQPEYLKPLQSGQLGEESTCLIVCPQDQVCDPREHACCPPPPTDV